LSNVANIGFEEIWCCSLSQNSLLLSGDIHLSL